MKKTIASVWRTLLQRTSSEGGFSLIESMMASVILGTGLLALAAMQGLSMVKNVDADELTRMTAVASDILERIQFNRRNAASYSNIQVSQAGNNCANITQPQASGDCMLWSTMVVGTNLQDVQGQVLVPPVVPLTPAAILGQSTVTVRLTWMGSQNADSSVKRQRVLTIDRIIAPE